ncbi:MAG TPA: hypothetical protein VF382_06155 [Actinomycetota bacterium]
MAATLSVPILGTRAQRIGQEASAEMVTLPVHPRRARLVSNDHNHADSLSLTLDWTEAGVDPRLLDDAVLTFYLANADDRGNWTPIASNCRFIGLARNIASHRSTGEAATVTLEADDYTNLFLKARPFGSRGIPDYSQTLEEAWRRIVSQTPGASALADRLVLRGLESSPKLGDAVGERFRKLAKVPANPQTDAWAVWQQCVGMLGLVSFVERDDVVVTTSTSLYTETDPPVLMWGLNLSDWDEERSSDLAGKGIGVMSYDPLTQRTIEAFYPPKGDRRAKRKIVSATPIGDQTPPDHTEHRDWYSFPGITDQAALDALSQRIYEERSRQELHGKATTSEWAVNTLTTQEPFELVGLRAGNCLQVTVDPRDRLLLASLGSPQEQRAYLVQRGYTPSVAELIVANLANLTGLSSIYFARTVTTELALEKDKGTFRVDVEYVNRILADGDTG